MIKELINRYPCLSSCEKTTSVALNTIIDCYEKGGKLILCGNGGSAADCEHIVGELMKGFLKKRSLSALQKQSMLENCSLIDEELTDKLQQGLPAVSLVSMSGLNSAVCNDTAPSLIFAQGVLSLGNKNDVLIAISTSGNSLNVCQAAKVAKGIGMKVVAFTGEGGGRLKDICDVTVCVPEKETYKIQELHLPLYHCLCAAVEDYFFGE